MHSILFRYLKRAACPLSDYTINVFEIAFLPEEAINILHSDFRIVADYFAHRRTDPDYRPKDPVRFKHVDEVLKLMAAITHDDRFVEAIGEEGGEPGAMDEFLDRVEEKGRQRGRLEGVDETRLESIKSVMEGLKYNAQQAMKLLKIPVSEQPKYSARL